MRRSPRVARFGQSSAAVAFAAVVAACGSSGGSAGSSPAGGTPTAGSAPAGKTVMVTETEYKITLSRTMLSPGTYTFIADDKGSATHALEINGPGVANKASSDINPGQSASLTVTLRKGTYDVFCPVDGHKQLGMDTHITVS